MTKPERGALVYVCVHVATDAKDGFRMGPPLKNTVYFYQEYRSRSVHYGIYVDISFAGLGAFHRIRR